MKIAIEFGSYVVSVSAEGIVACIGLFIILFLALFLLASIIILYVAKGARIEAP